MKQVSRLAAMPAASALPAGAVERDAERRRGGVVERVRDAVAEEMPVALLYNARPHAVMMASPLDLEDFALGFSLSEAIIGEAAQLEKIEIVPALAGIELHLRIPQAQADLLENRARELTGRSGCGLCGTRTLDAAVRHPRAVGHDMEIDEAALLRALADLRARQALNLATGAAHAAAWADRAGNLLFVREDIGRHNALDKLIGAVLRARHAMREGFALITSRASHELVMKAATAGIGLLAAISGPTALAIALARETNLALIAFARETGYSIYTHPQRVRPTALRSAAR